MKTAEEEYKLIPMSEITDEARKLAVAWMECEDKNWIGQKHKLASDIMNYAKKYHASQRDTEPKEEGKGAEDFVQYVTNLLYNAYADGKQKLDKDIFDQWVEEQTGLLSEFASQSHKEVTLPEDGCNHVIGANDESGCCIKCGKKVCEVINNNLHEKRES